MTVYAPITYRKNEASTIFEIPFDYLSKKFIIITIEDAYQNHDIDYEFLDKWHIRFLNKDIPALTSVTLSRRTDPASDLLSWKDISVSDASDLELYQLQLLHIAEEAVIAAHTALTNNAFRLARNVPPPIDYHNSATNLSIKKCTSLILETGQSPVNNAEKIIYTSDSGASSTLQALVGGMIESNLTINIPDQFSEPADAMNWLRTQIITNGATVTIKIANGTHSLLKSTSLNHPQGQNIQIIGNQIDKTLCQLISSADSTFDAFIISSGGEFGLLDGVIISKPSKAQGTGVLSINGSNLTCGPNVEVNNYYYSFAARDGGTMTANGVVSRNAGDVGIWAFNGGHMTARGAHVFDAIDVANDLGYGFQAEYGGTLECLGSSASGCRKAGIAAFFGGIVRAHSTNSSGNAGAGYLSGVKGHIAVNGATSNSNGTWGYDAIGDGTFSGARLGTENVRGLIKPVSYFENDTSGSIRAITGTPLSLGCNGSDGVILDVQGNIAFRCGTLSMNSANYGQVDATPSGSTVQYKARGSDTNINLGLSPKGAGVIQIGGVWNGAHLVMNTTHLWVDGTGRLRIKSSAPTSDTDGTVVGAQI